MIALALAFAIGVLIGLGAAAAWVVWRIAHYDPTEDLGD